MADKAFELQDRHIILSAILMILGVLLTNVDLPEGSLQYRLLDTLIFLLFVLPALFLVYFYKGPGDEEEDQ